MTRLFILAAIFCLAAPAALAVPPAGQGPGGPAATPSASQLCKQQRNFIGMSAFRALYAPTGTPKAAMDACLTKYVQVTSAAGKNAAKVCKAEQADPDFATGHDGKTFADYYGKNDKNAFGKCVSMQTTEQVEEQQDATLNAAKRCKAMRTSSAAAFDAAYGTKKNAYGKCVSKLGKEQGSSS
jgi:hypothetical protein